ncbi:hypothetical protein BUALT_Bualt16G0114600 [Buddleja alternifolia]|uniref:Late blight resistance protein homolog R1A-3 n=1 Tax=Buddleja alternifolia TaxID=168488 RepID=A0AAV6W8S6_9LAMI|nr:hypothetical protein BUALT_Bualt16G0114600 [Buddleja alternifolia]
MNFFFSGKTQWQRREGMAASSTKKTKLLQIFTQRIEWELGPDLNQIPLTHSYLSAAIGLLLEVRLESDFFGTPITTILWNNEWWYQDYFEKSSELVVYVTQEIEELFIFPKLQHLFEKLKNNEVMAAFIDFLVQLLSHGIGLIFPFVDSINNLKEELRCLVVILGDTDTSLEENLLAEFEAVANKAGCLVYSLFFATHLIDGTAVGALLEQIELLKFNIIKFSNLPPSSSIIKTDITTPEAAAVDSFSIIVSLLRDLEELISNMEDDLIVNMKGQINLLHQGLKLSLSFLKDIKVLRLLDIEELKEVVMRIRDVAYESDYLINSFLVGYARLWYLNIRIPNVIHKIKLIEIGIQEIEKKYNIGALKVAKDFSAQRSLHAKRNSDVEDIIVGLEDKTIDILDRLTGGKKHLQTLGIFGMPGLGKTTFAKKLYVHPTVNCYFDKLSWCIVSQAYQRKSVLIDILISLESELGRDMIFNMEEENLAEHIYKSLKGRRYLIVMDDIWDSNVWDDLRRCFPDDRNGSRILFTSRNRDVAPRNSIIHELPTLSNGQCWELLQKKVFGIETCPPQLLDVGNQIAISCCGLPLAVIVVAGILWTVDREKSAWENVGISLASYIFADKNNSTMQILELSYKHLPDHLKPCFLYFGACQKGKEIPVRKLKRLWIAEGFICKDERKSLESVAEEYLMELIGKSLVIVTGRRSDLGVKNCLIHDLLHDLCLRRAEEERFLTLVDDNYSIYGKHQRLYAPLCSVSLNPIYKASHLLLGRYGRHVRSFIGYLLMSPLNIVSMELLRVLDCWNTNSDDLVGIETLVHLRYLAIHAMPASIASFVNLEFFVVHNTISISSSLLKLARLRHLQAHKATFNKDCNSNQMVINNLEYLSNVCIHNVKDEEMLKCSPHLRKLKCDFKTLLADDDGTLSYCYPDLRFLTQLESLRMIYFNSLNRCTKDGKINFPSNIKKLTLFGFRLPWEEMSIIGALPNLEILKLEYNAMKGEIWETRDGEFQQLRFLKLEGLKNFSKWDEVSFSSEHFPKLQQLVLHYCFNLKEIPCAMGEIETLQLIDVERPQYVGQVEPKSKAH